MQPFTTSSEAWRRFVDEPARNIEPGRLAVCFGGALSADLCARLAASERLTERLSRRISARYELGDVPSEAVEETDREIALCAPDRLVEIARRAGAIYWSGALANVVLAKDVAALSASIGDEFYAFAIANRNLSGPQTRLPAVESAAELIVQDGWRCLNAWCAALSAGAGRRVRLKLPAAEALDGDVDSRFAEHGPAIVRRAAADQTRP